MLLKEYLKTERIGMTRAAKELRVHKTYLYEIVGRRMPPGRKLAQRIVEWSKRKITLEDLWE
jgi:hypothetical protein